MKRVQSQLSSIRYKTSIQELSALCENGLGYALLCLECLRRYKTALEGTWQVTASSEIKSSVCPTVGNSANIWMRSGRKNLLFLGRTRWRSNKSRPPKHLLPLPKRHGWNVNLTCKIWFLPHYDSRILCDADLRSNIEK